MIVKPCRILLIVSAVAASYLAMGCGTGFSNRASVAFTFTPRRASPDSRRRTELSVEPKVFRDAESAARGPRGSQSIQP